MCNILINIYYHVNFCALFCVQEVHACIAEFVQVWFLLNVTLSVQLTVKVNLFMFPHKRKCYEWTPLQLMMTVREKEPTAGRNLCCPLTLAPQVYGVMYTPNRAISKGPAAKG